MCGICGVLNIDGSAVSPALLKGMGQMLHHRGPDSAGLHVDGAVGLAHQRLKIIDLSDAAGQPMSDERESAWIVFNGEIYNFKDLRRQLEAKGHRFRSQSDTEVLLHLYLEYGEQCVESLDGMFAFGIWDRRRRQLFLARDRAGKKPLYYAHLGNTFLFASEVKAILRHPLAGGELAPEAIPHYFQFGYPPRGTTFYRGIQQLAPAHTLTVGEDVPSLRTRRYWDLDFSPVPGPVPSEPEVRERIRTLVTEAVRKRLVSDVPLGAFLSGGIDSSIVVGLMSRLLDQPVKTFSIGFTGDPSLDETSFARVVAKHFQTDHHEFIVEPKAINLIETLVWHQDGPVGDASAIPTSIVSQLTRQHVTVALTGDGGDEVFAGYLRFQACLAAEGLPPALVRLCDRALATVPEPREYHHWLRRAQRFFRVAADPLFTRLRKWISIFDTDLHLLIRPEVLETLQGGVVDFPPAILDRTAHYSTLSKVLYANFMTYLPEDLLVKTDRSSMGHSLEARCPFLDHRLVEYVAGLPDHYKLRRGTTKYILRTTFADLLPRDILRRGKKGFGVPLGAWFRAELRDYLQDLLLSPQALSRAYLRHPYVEELIREHLDGTRDHGLRLWTVLTFEIWLQLVHRKTWSAEPAGT